MKRVILTAGYDRALHVLALAELLRRDGVHVDGILVVSAMSLKRLRGLLRQRGLGFVVNSVPRLLGLRHDSKDGPEDETAAIVEQVGLRSTSLRSWAKSHRVDYCLVSSINHRKALSFLKEKAPDWVVYGGGGILGTRFIQTAKRRILNAHSGKLPEIRGMNACEWSLLLGVPPAVTVHAIDRGIDTGGIVQICPLDVIPGDSIESLRSRCVALGVSALRIAVANIDELPEVRDNAAGHRQCFVLAPALRGLLEQRLFANACHDEDG